MMAEKAAPSQHSDGQDNAGTSVVPKLAVLGLFVGAFVAAWAFGLLDFLSFEALRANREWLTSQVVAYGVVAGLAYIVLYAAVVAFSLPGGAVMTISGGFLFGQWLGTLYTVFGATIGAVCLFLAAKYVLRDSLRARFGPSMRKMEAGFQEDALSYMLVLRLVPLFPFVVVNLVPALLGVRLGTYALTTFFGIIPGTFVYSSVGNGLGAIFDAGEDPDLSGILTKPEIITPIVGLAVLACIPIVYKRLRARRQARG